MSADEFTVKQLFKEGQNLLNSCDDYPAQSEEYKKRVMKATLMLEDATRAVSALDMFSRNEELSDLPVENICFLSLPYYLGLLTLRSEYKDPSQRLEILKSATIYFNDFIKRAATYGLFTGVPAEVTGDSLEKMRAERASKIERRKLMNALEAKANELRVSEGEESLKYWKAFLEKQCLQARDELDMIAREMPVVDHAIKLAARGDVTATVPERRPGWKPVTICRDEIQKRVFGLGYPSRPTLTVAEFYEKRVSEGWYQCGVKKAEAEIALGESDEAKAERRDEEEESDDPAALQKARNWDEFKDENPRGWGNRHNKG